MNGARASAAVAAVPAPASSRAGARAGADRAAERPRPAAVAHAAAERPVAVRSVPGAGAAPGARPAVEPTALPGVVAPPPTTVAPLQPPAAEPARLPPPGAPVPAARSAVPLLMPEPPAGPSQADRVRLRLVAEATGAAGAAQQVLPQPAESMADARRAVDESVAETTARAAGGLIAALEARPAPSPAIETLCRDILQMIRERRPPDEASLLRSRPEREAEAAGAVLEGSVRQETDAVRAGYDQMASPPAGSPAQQGQPATPPPAQIATPSPGATRAVPDPVPAEQVALDADAAASGERMHTAGMDSPAARAVQSGPIAEARAAQGELTQLAATDPAQVLAEQQAAREQATADMAALERQAVAVLQAGRAGTVADLTRARDAATLSEEQLREQASTRARAIYDNARERVEALLEPLPRTAMALWETGLQELSRDFEAELDRVERWKRERYAQTGGSLIELYDEVVGLPDWVGETYDRAERAFGDGVCALLRRVSTHVNGVIQACERIIEDADRGIAEVFDVLPASLATWAEGQQTQFRGQLDGLRERVAGTQARLTADLAERGGAAVQQVRERIHQLRVEAGGLIGRVQVAIDRFLEDPARFIINGLLELAGIVASAFWALVDRIGLVISDIADDPLGFANNLASAIGAGFRRFFDNFTTHILGGFFDWLFSGLGAVGVNLPRDVSPQSLITFFLELMGITWQRIRALLVRLIGERNVAVIEQAMEIIAELIALGPSGLFELIEEQLNPRDMIRQVVDAAVNFLVETLIVRVSARLIAMFNPAGAIIQAIEVIYRILDWIFSNAARIFSLVETVVNGAAALIAGNITGMATAVEGALARLIGPVIDFLAGFLGLGALPDRIADTIRGFQEWVMRIIERVIRALAARARALLARLGGGRPADGRERADTELGETVQFTAGGERHRLWVTAEHRGATLFIASAPRPVGELLEDWSGRVDRLSSEAGPAGGRPPQQEARSLLTQAGMLLRTADADADRIAAAWAATPATGTAGQGTARPSDDALEAHERQLADVLRRLFELFGEEGSPAVSQYISRRMVTRDPATNDPQDRILRQAPPGYVYNPASGRIDIRKLGTGPAAGPSLPHVHLDAEGRLALGRPSGRDTMAYLRTEDIISCLSAYTPPSGWLALFATSGVKLRSAPGPDAAALTLADVWRAGGGGADRRREALRLASAAYEQSIRVTMAQDSEFEDLLRGFDIARVAHESAREMLALIEGTELVVVRHTDLPRYMSDHQLVRINPAASAEQQRMIREFYSKLAESGEDEVLSTLRGEVHHIVPLYLGGGHAASNLMRAFGRAATADTAHRLMHQLIDETVVTAWVDGVEMRGLSLDYSQLANRIPRDALRVLIGILLLDGHIRYDDRSCMIASGSATGSGA